MKAGDHLIDLGFDAGPVQEEKTDLRHEAFVSMWLRVDILEDICTLMRHPTFPSS